MSLAIRVGNSEDKEVLSGLFYVNATERYEITYQNRVTKHPLDSGASIGDHVVMENPVFTIQGVISGVDVDLTYSQVYEEVLGDKPMNVRSSQTQTTITKDDNKFAKFIPDIVGQFLKSGGYNIQFSGSGEDADTLQRSVLDLVVNTMTKITYNKTRNRYFNSVVPVTLYELGEKKDLVKAHRDLVITSFNIKEDAESGAALFFNMTLEQFRSVGVEMVAYSNVDEAVKKSASTKKSQGNVGAKDATGTGTEAEKASSPDIDPARDPEIENRTPVPTP